MSKCKHNSEFAFIISNNNYVRMLKMYVLVKNLEEIIMVKYLLII